MAKPDTAIAPRRYFLDTEFFQDESRDSRLISIGIIAEDDAGAGFYAISSAFNAKAAARVPWVRDHVLAKLDPKHPRLAPEAIADGVIDYIRAHPRIEFWARNGSFDFYQLCQIFARDDQPSSMLVMNERLRQKGCKDIDLRDIDEVRRIAGHPKMPKAPEAEQHISINDARWDRDQFPDYARIAHARAPEAARLVLG